MGCTKVSPGCAHCYMFREQRQYGNDPELVRRSKTTFNKPLKWAEGKLVFTCSWSDWFHETADPWREDAWDIVRRCPQHTFQILTKRPELIADRLPADWGDGYPNVWLGVSVENSRYTWRADVLREIPAALRFISAEPLLGSLFLKPRPLDRFAPAGSPTADDVSEGGAPTRERAPLDLTGIGWVIVGGESGFRKDARPLHPTWAREIRDAIIGEDSPWYWEANDLQGRPIRPSLHFKQWGSWAPVRRTAPNRGDFWLLPDGSTETYQGEDAERDIGYCLIRYDGTDAVLVRYAGPTPDSGGKILDGVDWCEIPKRKVLA